MHNAFAYLNQLSRLECNSCIPCTNHDATINQWMWRNLRLSIVLTTHTSCACSAQIIVAKKKTMQTVAFLIDTLYKCVWCTAYDDLKIRSTTNNNNKQKIVEKFKVKYCVVWLFALHIFYFAVCL